MARGFPTPRSPEIKISVRTVNDNKAKPFNIASLLTPNIGFSSASQARPGDGCRPRALIASLQGEWAERVPHFMVRDVRDNKYKLLTPIHQVRDMRKLVKSSYHFVSVDSQGKSTAAASSGVRGEQTGGERKSMALFSPMVIKCQSVNTNSRPDLNRPGHVLKAFRRRPPVIEEAAEPESANASGGGDRKPESKAGKAAALEKLQAAVRTMEELYVFDRYEWKRRTQAPQPVTDSHVLSLITREEHGEPGAPAGSDTPYPAERTPEPPAREDGRPGGRGERSGKGAAKSPPPQQRGVFSSRSAPGAGNGHKTPPRAAAAANTAPQPHPAPAAAKSLPPKAAKLPVSLKITQPKCTVEERDVPGGTEAQPGQPTGADCGGNYLTIPVQQPAPGRAQELTQPAPAGSEPGQDRAAARSASPPAPNLEPPPWAGEHARRRGNADPGTPRRRRLPADPGDSVAGRPGPGHVLPPGCAPTGHAPLPAPPPADPAQQTQRKMLLDPTTGQFYLVDTPVSPATRKLYDPRDGAVHGRPRPAPARHARLPAPVPLSPLSPWRLRRPQPQPLRHPHSRAARSPQLQSQHAASRGRGSTPDAKPIISITSRQQGPRIVAPPSFDGTTMSFVVEHRSGP
ncbi:hypothetical protein ANANG_G00111550 [Anguilla anguilla]|uniref:DUF4585 domain-containing protein n=1 Tax=Anguilla anguilla TaxID=7936 RepID=A0A9D3MNG0_ANGAN|nr:hypothetical protein ANANG_G00111550 [Anguilla anguilla]